MNLYLVGAVLLSVVGRYLWERRRWYALAWRMPCQLGLPLIGVVDLLDPSKVIDAMARHSDRYGNLSSLWIGPRLFVFVNQPQHIEQILNSPLCIDKGLSYKFIEKIVGNGLITLKGDAWRQHRRLLNPSFHYNITSKFVPLFNRNLRVLVEQMGGRCGGGEFDIKEYMKRCSMDMICETTMDNQTNAQSGANSEYVEAVDNALAVVGVRMFNALCQPDWLFWLSRHYAMQTNTTRTLADTVNAIVARKTQKHPVSISGLESAVLSKVQQQRAARLVDDDDDAAGCGRVKHIFIDRLLKLSTEERSFTLLDVQNESNTMLIAGFETTATTMSMVMLMLAMHPELQQRVYEEVRPLLDDERDVTQAQLGDLRYLDMFIKETLRLFPVVPFLTRTTSADLQIGDYQIPGGTELILGVMAMHRSRASFAHATATDALAFDPDNFLPDRVAERHAYSYIPFSGGPRACIGIRYANIVLKMCVVYVLKSYRISTRLRISDLRFRMNVTLNLLTTHLVRLHRRDANRDGVCLATAVA